MNIPRKRNGNPSVQRPFCLRTSYPVLLPEDVSPYVTLSLRGIAVGKNNLIGTRLPVASGQVSSPMFLHVFQSDKAILYWGQQGSLDAGITRKLHFRLHLTVPFATNKVQPFAALSVVLFARRRLSIKKQRLLACQTLQAITIKPGCRRSRACQVWTIDIRWRYPPATSLPAKRQCAEKKNEFRFLVSLFLREVDV